jgi:peptidyl-prolyl cis-trans isomerase SurA
MTHRVLAPRLISLAILACLAAGTALSTQAQGLKLSPQRPSTPPPVTSAPAGAQQPSDFIVAVVNSEPITNSEVRRETQRLLQQLAQQRRQPPEMGELSRQVLERLINDKAQLQLARDTGVKVEDEAVDQAELGLARQNQVAVPELHRRLALDGISASQFREQLRDQMMVSRLREREVEGRVRVSDAEVEQYMRDQQNNVDPAGQNINIAQILIAVPDGAGPVQLANLQTKAETALARARAGEDFAGLVRELSDAPDRNNGGQMGLRGADRYPPLFVQATQSLAVGGLSGVLRSGAGFHVLKVIEKQAAGLPGANVTQNRARHILLRPSPQLSETAARDKLADFKKRIEAGQADFATLARENSQDGSAAQGGDLDWASPGQFVPEFEEVMNSLAPGQISAPFVSRFGLHLIQLTDRRTVTLGVREQREAVRAILREKKLDETYTNWAQDVRGKAYVEMREPPL